jgi:hypothetical protein
MIKKQTVKSRNRCKVTFELPADLEADAVYLHADAHGWQPVAFEKLKNGKWKLVQEFELGQRVQFRYRVVRGGNDEYLNDADADETVTSEIGTENAVIRC